MPATSPATCTPSPKGRIRPTPFCLKIPHSPLNEAVHAALDNVGARMSVLRNDMGQVAHSGFQMSREAEDTDASLGQHLGAAM